MMLEILAWILVLGIFGGLVAAVPVTRSVKKCTWKEAVITVLTYVGLLDEEQNLILSDIILQNALLKEVEPYSSTKAELTIEDNIAIGIHGNLPCITINFISKREIDVQMLENIIMNEFQQFVRRYYSEHYPACIVTTYRGNRGRYYIEIQFPWTKKELSIFQAAAKNMQNADEEKVELLHQRPSDQMLDQKLKAAKEKEADRAQEEVPVTEKKTAD